MILQITNNEDKLFLNDFKKLYKINNTNINLLQMLKPAMRFVQNYKYDVNGGLHKKEYLQNCKYIWKDYYTIKPYSGTHKPVCGSKYNNIIIGLMLTYYYIMVWQKQ